VTRLQSVSGIPGIGDIHLLVGCREQQAVASLAQFRSSKVLVLLTTTVQKATRWWED